MTHVTGLIVNSQLGQVDIRVERRYSGQRADATDLPTDARQSLLKWLGVDEPTSGCGKATP